MWNTLPHSTPTALGPIFLICLDIKTHYKKVFLFAVSGAIYRGIHHVTEWWWCFVPKGHQSKLSFVLIHGPRQVCRFDYKHMEINKEAKARVLVWDWTKVPTWLWPDLHRKLWIHSISSMISSLPPHHHSSTSHWQDSLLNFCYVIHDPAGSLRVGIRSIHIKGLSPLYTVLFRDYQTKNLLNMVLMVF